MKYIFYLLITLMLFTEACKPPRCTIPSCYVRMKHRHGGENWKAATARAESEDGTDVNAIGGTEYRGVPWWKKNKNPKIAEGYKPGYKYDYRKPKYKKPKEKKSRNSEQDPLIAGEEQVSEGQTQSPDSTSAQPERKKGFFNKLRSKKSKKTESEAPVEEQEQTEESPKQAPADKKDGF